MDQEESQTNETGDKDKEETENTDKDNDASPNETTPSEPEFIKLRVVGADQKEILFKIKSTTQMYKLKNSYSERMGIPVSTLRFLFDGKRISDDETPKKLDMKNDDMLEVYQEQTGGRILKNS